MASSEGPVMSVISKRLRALNKKLSRISQMEAKGSKTLNAEQHETVRSKPAIIAAIEELNKLRPALSAAVSEELALSTNGCQEKTLAKAEPVEDLLKLIYFGATFDLMKQNDFTMMMLTRAHERQSCLSYDTMLKESNAVSDTLCEKDLDLVAKLGNLLISRSVDSSFSHKNSIEQCIQHAKQWLANSDLPVDSDSNVTYAEMRAKLNRIITSGYFIASPEIKATVDIAAAAAENYLTFQVPVEAILVRSEEDSLSVQFQQKGDESAVYQENGTNHSQSSYVEEAPKVESQPENLTTEVTTQADVNNSQEEEQNNGDSEWKERNNRSRRNSNNHRGGRGGGRRGFPNGRGPLGSSRGGGPYYPNGHSHDYENGDFYPKRYFNKEKGDGRGGGGNNFNANHGSGAQGVYTAVES